MVPTTFHGISSGSAISTRQTLAQKPFFGMHSATATPSGISIRRMIAENSACRHSAACIRSEARISLNQPTPFQKNTLLPKVSCNA